MSHDEKPHGSNGGTLAAALLEFMQQHGTVLSVPAGERLFRENEPCQGAYYVEAGELELSIASGERKMVMGVVREGHLLGLPSVIRNFGHQHTATAIQECKVLFVESGKMRDYLQNHPESCLQGIQMMGAEILELSTNMIRPLRLQPRYPKGH